MDLVISSSLAKPKSKSTPSGMVIEVCESDYHSGENLSQIVMCF